MNCPNKIHEDAVSLRCSILIEYGVNEVAGTSNPNHPCAACQAQWVDGNPPTPETVPPSLYNIINRIGSPAAHQTGSDGRPEQGSPAPIESQRPVETVPEGQPEPQRTAPSTLAQARSYLDSMWQYAKNSFQEVPHDVYEHRLATCQSCPHFKDNTCGLCGCKLAGPVGFVSKLLLPHERCPDDRWPSYNPENSS